MKPVLKRVSLIMGIVLLVISMFFSYDGFDSSAGNDGNYQTLAKIIGWCIAVSVAVIQFIFSTDYKGLNWTLRIVGIVSYAYSIWSNKLGIVHTLIMPDTNAWIVAVFMDVVPEPLIGWSLGEALQGDFLGNVGKMVFGSNNDKQQPKKQIPVPAHMQQKSHYQPKHKPAHLGQHNHPSAPMYPTGGYVDGEGFRNRP